MLVQKVHNWKKVKHWYSVLRRNWKVWQMWRALFKKLLKTQQHCLDFSVTLSSLLFHTTNMDKVKLNKIIVVYCWEKKRLNFFSLLLEIIFHKTAANNARWIHLPKEKKRKWMLLSMRCILQCYNLQYHNNIIIFLDTGNCTCQFLWGLWKLLQKVILITQPRQRKHDELTI